MAVVVRSYPGVPTSPADLWRRAHPGARNGFVLGSGAGSANDRVAYCSVGEPRRLWTARPAAARRLLRSLERQAGEPADPAPRFVGWLSFDAARGFDSALARLPRRPDRAGLPTVFFADYPAVVRMDFVARRTDLICRGSRSFADSVRRRFERALAAPSSRVPARRGRLRRVSVETAAAFKRKVAAAKEAIAAGDIYQTNLSLRFDRPFSGDPTALYDELCRRNPSPYAAIVKSGETWIVSCSPELLLDAERRGGHVATRPIAGTRPRGKNANADRRRRGLLLLSPKERAEHVMLVDLERNDLGRVCRPGSVRVTERLAVERYSHVMHIVSQVEGRLAAGRTPADALMALFPGGTITGCPKIRAIEIIEALERETRSLFYGSAGYVAGNGDAKFNILIRTALIRRGRLTLRAGAGIVADSRAEREYREAWDKARAVLEAADRTDGGKTA
ncbi:MAG: anthranilate synthase component I family protein [Elusimicrobia bacterium]|nr:anthranilate synthase component I family protein [Elusimicrobiota bacterium]